MLKIISFSKHKILIVVMTLTYLVLLIGNSYVIKSQDNQSDKCGKIIETFDKTVDDLEKSYIECGGSKIIDQFFPSQLERFGITNLEDEWARLDVLATRLQSDPKLMAYIVIYGGKINKFGELKERPKPLVYYLTTKRGVEPKRIKIIEGGFREKFEFEFWTTHSEKIFPPLSPTVDREKAVFRGKMKSLPVDF